MIKYKIVDRLLLVLYNNCYIRSYLGYATSAKFDRSQVKGTFDESDEMMRVCHDELFHFSYLSLWVIRNQKACRKVLLSGIVLPR